MKIGNVTLENIPVSDKLTGTDKNGKTVEVVLPVYSDAECTQVITEIAELEVNGENIIKETLLVLTVLPMISKLSQYIKIKNRK